MLTPAEQTAWNTYVAEMAARGVKVDLSPLIDVLLSLDEFSEAGRVIAATLRGGQVPVTDLAQRLTLQTRQIVQTGHVPTA